MLRMTCVQAPRTANTNFVKGTRSQANAMALQALIAHWQGIVKILANYLRKLKDNHVSVARHIEFSLLV